MKPSELVLCEFVNPAEGPVESWSPFCLKVRRALALAGLDFASRQTYELHEFADLNPAQQVPILVADGTPIADSTAILDAIEAWTDAPPLDPRARAEALLYEEMADSGLYGYVLASRWADPNNWPKVRATFFGPTPDEIVLPVRKSVVDGLYARDITRAGLETCWQRHGALLDALDGRAPVEGFWLGETLSRADLALFAQVRSMATDLTPAQADAVMSRRRLWDWIERVDAATGGAPAERGPTR